MVYLMIGIGGLAGSLLRYSLSVLTVHFWDDGFPVGTLIINLTGSFFLGWFSSKFIAAKRLSPSLTSFISTGFIGSYTTFSTFSLETIHLLEAGEYINGLLYVIISLLAGLLLVRLGVYIGGIKKKETGKTI
jgi:fluoride exporter